MRLIPLANFILCSIVVALVTGCSPTKPIYLNDTGSLNHYVDQATTIDYPDIETQSLEEVIQSRPPITVIEPDFDNYVDLSLESAIHYALQNGKLFRGYGTPALQGTRVLPGQDTIINAPNAVGTVYNVAIRESEPGVIGVPGQIGAPAGLLTNTQLDSNQGVEAALSQFDAQLTSSFNFTKSDEPRNTVATNPNQPLVFQQDQVQWQTQIAKDTASGTQLFFRNVTSYTANSNPVDDPATPPPVTEGFQVLDSFYRVALEAEIRQPLLRGRGAFINRMPVVISRINTDQEIANLEAQLQNFVTNIEIRYWDLYAAYRSLQAAKNGRDAALKTFRIVKDQFDERSDVNKQQVAQSSEQYHFFDAQVAEAYNTLLNAEGQLRFLLGWAANDGNMIRPIDEPVFAPVEFDYYTTLCEALTYRPELRTLRWEIRKRELAVAYSKNGLLPELNLTSLYRFLGLGNRLGTSDSGTPFPDQGSGALNELYDGTYQELSFSLNFGLPVGFRAELANVRNAQLKLAREMARLEEAELDVNKEIHENIQLLATNLKTATSHFNRWRMSLIEKDVFDELKNAGAETLDVALDAQRRLSQAEIAFYQSVTEYNKGLALLHRRKGTILAYCGIGFEEGPWAGKAYLDAAEHSRRRGASRELVYGWSRPEVISRGEDWPSSQNIGTKTGERSEFSPVNDGGIPAELPPVEIFNPGPALNAPTPANAPAGGSTTKNHYDGSVRQVSYESDSQPAAGGQRVSQPTAKVTAKPRARRLARKLNASTARKAAPRDTARAKLQIKNRANPVRPATPTAPAAAEQRQQSTVRIKLRNQG